MLYFTKWKIILVLGLCLIGAAFAAPNLFSAKSLTSLPSWIPNQQVNLGLDLRGGAHLLLEVDVKAVIKKRMDTLQDDVRQVLRRQQPQIGYAGGLNIKGKTLTLRIRKQEQYADALSRIKKLASPIQTSLFSGVAEKDIEVVETGNMGIEVNLTEASVDHLVKSSVSQSIEVIRKRIDNMGTTEPTIQQQGQDRVLVQVPGLGDTERLEKLIGKTAVLTFHLVDASMTAKQALASRPPAGSEILYEHPPEGPPIPVLIKKRAMVSGENLTSAQPSFDQRTGQPVVTFGFDTVGGKRFGKVTQANVGRRFAIILDREVISAPVIQEAILGGSGQISGNFTVKETNDLSIMLRAGALPAPLTIVQRSVVGPGLGADQIASGQIASVIGLVGVVVFILITYGLFGVFANLALGVNLILIFGILSMLQATLTLPGIAGIVLTIGMAVDANVLIFERIREEIRNGKSPMASVEAGYSRALGTILDANITTFIAASLLFLMGSGPVRGFAVTLAIGIITSVFTAFTLTRMIVVWWLRSRRPKAIPL
ncbi:MAG: protein translocase subunit SecD [Hyphomicrobiales bacterium]|nr:MAG: protein translocase subunit SecD [Hyphomicrobiales bacterium]